MPGTHTFQIAAGSIVGRDHIARGDLLIGRPNQDGFAAYNGSDILVAVVTDGCSSGDPRRKLEPSRNHIGAAIGAKLLVKEIVAALHRDSQSDPRKIVSTGVENVVARLRDLATALTLPGGSFTSTVTEYFLFTVVGALILPDVGLAFSIGDGAYGFNGDLRRLGPFPNNAPPYLGYRLINSGFTPEELEVAFKSELSTDVIDSMFLGSDGVYDLVDGERRLLPGKDRMLGPLSQFWTEDVYFENPDAVRRLLALANSACKRLRPNGSDLENIPGLLADDTTLIAIRRAPETKEGGQ